MPEPSTQPKRPDLRLPFASGLVIVILFFGVFLGWAAFAPLNSAAIAVGELGVESKRKQIAHLEGGIIVAIEVGDGEFVDKGQALVLLDQTQAAATLQLVTGRYQAAQALAARYKAERDGATEIIFDPEQIELAETQAEVAEMLAAQRSIFSARREALDGMREILRRRIDQYRAEIKGLRNEIAGQRKSLRLIQEEVDANQSLVKKGLASLPRMLELKREGAGIEGELGRNEAAVARVMQSIAESELEITRLDTERLNEVVQGLRDTQSQLYDLTEQRRAAQDVWDRTVIKAPIAGTVVGLQVHTVGGILAPGESVLDIVPANERLIVEARVSPDDIDVVQPGRDAHIRFTAFSSTSHIPLDAKVVNVSADRLIDERTGEVYYSAIMSITDASKASLEGETLYPGMQAEVMIVTGARTPLDYLVAPLMERINRAFRES